MCYDLFHCNISMVQPLNKSTMDRTSATVQMEHAVVCKGNLKGSIFYNFSFNILLSENFCCSYAHIISINQQPPKQVMQQCKQNCELQHWHCNLKPVATLPQQFSGRVRRDKRLIRLPPWNGDLRKKNMNSCKQFLSALKQAASYCVLLSYYRHEDW